MRFRTPGAVVGPWPEAWGSQVPTKQANPVPLFVFQLPLSLLKTAQNHPMVSRRHLGRRVSVGASPGTETGTLGEE